MVTYKITNQETFENRVVDVDFENISCFFNSKGELSHIEGTVMIQTSAFDEKQIQGEHGVNDYIREYGFEILEIETFDVQFDDDNNSDRKGFEMNQEECADWIDTWNGTDHSYFDDYKGGTVSIVSNLTDEVVASKTVK